MSTLRSDYKFELPKALIAQHPAQRRDGSRLLVLGQTLSHLKFPDLATLLNPGDLLVMNDTRVVPARLYAQKDSGGKVEILLERIDGDCTALCQIRASKALKTGRQLTIENCEVQLSVGSREGSLFRLHFPSPVTEILQQYGQVPLPPYIERNAIQAEDEERYQTVYAQHAGAVAAPTAGLHFDETLMQTLRSKGVGIEFITLHVGAGTFSPVRAEKIEEHVMHYERFNVGSEVIAAINATRSRGGRIIAVGTTVVRSLETLAALGVFELEASPLQSGETNIFIYPGYKFQVVDALLTNFHVSESSLIMLVSAFAGRRRTLAAYAEAVAEQYRFFSYGDSMFIPARLADIER